MAAAVWLSDIEIPGRTKEWHVTDGKPPHFAPSVPKPERFPSLDKSSRTKLPPSVDFPCSMERSVGLSVSGAVAPSAPAQRIMRELVSSAGVFDLTYLELAHEAFLSMR